METPRMWVRSLHPALATQSALLERLLDAVELDPRWEWLELSCSVAAGRGDALSDLDLGLGYSGGQIPTSGLVTAMLAGLGPVIDVVEAPLGEERRWWVQYADGGQIDLVVMAAEVRPGRAPGAVALLDRAGRLSREFTPSVMAATAEEPRRWLLDGWEALANTSKYLRRGALLEACEQVSRARHRICQLWAVGEGVPYPTFGLTSLLDAPSPTLPLGIEATYPHPAESSVQDAARMAAGLLYAAGEHAERGLDSPLRQYVSDRLGTL